MNFYLSTGLKNTFCLSLRLVTSHINKKQPLYTHIKNKIRWVIFNHCSSSFLDSACHQKWYIVKGLPVSLITWNRPLNSKNHFSTSFFFFFQTHIEVVSEIYETDSLDWFFASDQIVFVDSSIRDNVDCWHRQHYHTIEGRLLCWKAPELWETSHVLPKQTLPSSQNPSSRQITGIIYGHSHTLPPALAFILCHSQSHYRHCILRTDHLKSDFIKFGMTCVLNFCAPFRPTCTVD